MTLLFPLFSHGEGPKFREPDFDYPVKVEKEARQLLAEAQKQQSPEAGRIRLRALVELFAAQTAIDGDSAFTQPAKVAALIAAPNNTPSDRAMLLTLQARIYQRILQSAYWRYSQVDSPLTPLPADVSEWSAEQFRSEINRLLAEALAIPEAATTPLSDYSASVSCDSIALIYLPTVRDFILYQGADFNNNDYNNSAPISYVDLALQLCTPATAPYFYWSVEKIQRNSIDSVSDLFKLYSENSGVESARYVLDRLAAAWPRRVEVSERRRRIIDFLSASLQDFPYWYGNSDLSYYLRNLTSPVAQISGPDFVAPGVEFPVEVNYSFTDSLTLYLFHRQNDNYIDPEKLVKRFKPELVKTIGNSPEGKCTVYLSTSQQGKYWLVGCLNGNDGKPAYACYSFESVGFIPLAFSGRDKTCVLTLDYSDGNPVSGVRVSMVSNAYADRSKEPVLIGTTPASGMLEMTGEGKYRYLKFAYKGYTTDFNRRINLYNLGGLGDDMLNQQSMIVLTDRPIYHPGDSLAWAVVLAEKEKDAKTIAGADISVVLLNANYQPVDTVEIRTDAFGRGDGTFVIPTGVLTGRYTVKAQFGKRTVGQTSVMVSDFRPPVFYAEVTSVQRDVPAKGAVRVEGRARTFSGMPVANATVAVTLIGSPRWWRMSPQEELATYSLTTDSDGCFTIDFPSDVFPDRENGDEKLTDFSANIIVTAADASTASTVARFTLGKPYSLSVDLPSSHDTSSPLNLTFRALNADGKTAPLAVNWSIAPVWNKNEHPAPLASGQAICDTPADLRLNDVPAGRYWLTVAPADSTLADPFTSGSILVLYNIERNQVPDIPDEPFFIPENSVMLNVEGKATAYIGVTVPTTIFTIVDDNGYIQAIQCRKLSVGFSKLPVEFQNVADENPYMGMKIVNVIAGETTVGEIIFSQPAKPEPKLVVRSFRDKLTPGDTETWTIRLLDADGAPIPSAPAIATMYNRALEDLCASNWHTRLAFSSPRYQLSYSILGNYSNSIQLYPVVNHDGRKPIDWPYWLYINQISSRKYMSIRGYAAAKSESSNGFTIIDEEEPVGAVDISGGVNDLNMAMVASPAAGVTLAYDSAEVAEEEVAVATEADGGTPEEKADFRHAEVLQAFWMPSLVADAEGNIDIVFTVPNANATWTFRSLAWTPEARTAALALEALANKPVMVQPNLPRFLRQGDVAFGKATVYNNSGNDATVETTVEIFDLTTNVILGSAVFSDSIAAGASAIVQIELPAQTAASAIGYRVRSRLGSFSDGEQGLIPILPSSATVIESSEFYLNPADSEPFTLTVPAAKDATVTLQYCQNPVWSVVRAMRGLGSSDDLTSTSLVGKLFSALAAQHIIAGNPAIAAAVRGWSDNPDSRALESMLSRNEDLKKLMLDQTPWVQTAADQSTRMAALVNVLDPERAETAVSEYVGKIVKLQAANGGIRWTSWVSEPSAWATRTVLTTLGIAHSLGMLPSDNRAVTELIQSAWSYVCAEAVRPKAPDTDYNLAYIAAMLPGLKSDAVTERIISRTIDNIRLTWKGSSVTSKAYDVLILKANGLDREAAPILESIREFAVDRPGMGKCFPNISDIRSYATIIQAYKVMDAPASEIDRLRQWVIVQSQASDDLFAFNPDYVIAAVMLTGTDWTDVTVAEHVTVDGRPVEIDNIESATGYFSQSLQPDGKPLTVTVTPNGVTPSYGSVISISKLPMSSIKAHPGRDLSIEKRVLVQRHGKWIETNNFALGERLRVQLIIKAKRALDYVTIDDERPAAFEPVDQLPGYLYANGLGFYRENLDASTRLFVGHVPAGTYMLTYDMTANVAGTFISGIATLQSQYAPELTAHSSAASIKVD